MNSGSSANRASQANRAERPNGAEGATGASWFDLALVLAAEAALVVGLHLVGSAATSIPLQELGSWLRTADAVTALVALARTAGLAIGYWLLITTLAYGVAYNLGLTGVTGALRWITLPVIRRAVQGVTAMSLTGATLLGPAAVTVGPAVAEEVVTVALGQNDGEPADDDRLAPDDTARVDAAGWPGADDDSSFWRPAAMAADADRADYTVVPDDHFWSIAEDHLRAVSGRDVTEDEICQYWIKVVEANRATIISGDPDLIYPDERITLPPVFAD